MVTLDLDFCEGEHCAMNYFADNQRLHRLTVPTTLRPGMIWVPSLLSDKGIWPRVSIRSSWSTMMVQSVSLVIVQEIEVSPCPDLTLGGA
jgi:hypothetical protein